MRRARVVEQVAKSGKRSAYRPGREASIIRRLLRRHSGALPPQTLVRLWRELLAGTTAMQGPFAVAVCEPDGGAGFTQAAREHFGALTPLRAYGSPAQAMAEVSRGSAAVAVLPMPSETDTTRERLVDRAAAEGRAAGACGGAAAVLGAAAGWRADRPGAGDRHHRAGSVRARPLAARPRTGSATSAAPG